MTTTTTTTTDGFSSTPPPSTIASTSDIGDGATQPPGPECTCDEVNTFLYSYGTTHSDGCTAAVTSCAKNAYNVLTSFSEWTCSYNSTRSPQYEWSCTDAPPGGTGASGGGDGDGNLCAGEPMLITDECCKDGPGAAESSDYPCPFSYSCGKGQCIPAGSKLCVDGPDGSTDYVCSAGTTCGRGACTPAGSVLCGTSGTTMCSAGTTCCGTTEATKDTDMECNGAADPCPVGRRSSTSYTSVPYVYSSSSTPPSITSTSDITAGSEASVTADDDHVCDILNPSLGGTPCTCSETTGGTGAIVECMESIAGVGDVGVRVQMEPCGDPAHAEISYKFGGEWESADRIEANGEPLHVPVPGASLAGAGLYIEVKITGNAADLSVHAKLSACYGDECDGDVSVFGVGSMLSAAGFPFALVEFDDLSFVEACPISDVTMAIIAAAAGGGALLLMGAGFLYKKKKTRKPPTPGDVVMTTTSSTTTTSTSTSSGEKDENKV